MRPRRSCLVVSPLLLHLLALLCVAANSLAQRPNLLLVVTDDQRFDQMGCAGHPVLQTPVMDRLAADGVRFDNAFVSTAICAASRASILTGRREGRHGYTFGTPPMTRDLADQTYLRLLTQHGYRTGFVGKWGVRFDDGALEGAIAYRKTPSPPFLGKHGEHLTDRLAEHAVEFLQQADERPFCLTLSFHAPHAQDEHPDQYIPPPALAWLYADADVPVPPHADDGFAALPEFLQHSMGRERWHWRFDSRDKQVRRTRDYWRMITGVDRALGRVLDALEASGHADDTVVIFTSDNGYFLGERGLAGKWLIYEESIRVPLIVRDPRLPAARRGVVQHEMALNLDLAPTLLALAGVPAPADYDGADLMPLVRGEQVPWREDFLYEHRFDNRQIPKSVGVRGQRWVYACYDEQQPPFEQLFDLQQDPDELHDLARDPAHAETLATMRARCAELRGAPLPLPVPATPAANEVEPLRAFVLLGQSNMVGFGRVDGLDSQGTLEQLAAQGRYGWLRDHTGAWTTRDDVWCVKTTVGQRQGPLAPGFGARAQLFGPELGFGHVVGERFAAPVLLIKASQGNRSLGWDILPPGSERFEHDGRTYAGYGDKAPSWREGEEKKEVDWYAGRQYDDFVRDVHEVLGDIQRFWPAYDGRPVQVAGFVWWQGHKDQNAAHASRYEQNLVHLIRSLRAEFDAPDAPFVLATIGFDGAKLAGPGLQVAEAQLAVSGETGRHPEFAGNVKTIDARPLWRAADVSPSRQGHHYNHNAETYLEVGLRLGEAMVELLDARPK